MATGPGEGDVAEYSRGKGEAGDQEENQPALHRGAAPPACPPGSHFPALPRGQELGARRQPSLPRGEAAAEETLRVPLGSASSLLDDIPLHRRPCLSPERL